MQVSTQRYWRPGRFWPVCCFENDAVCKNRQLGKAVGSGNLNQVERLLKSGASPLASNGSRLNENAVHKAAKYDQLAALNQMIGHMVSSRVLQADLAPALLHRNHHHLTPLELAISRKSNRVVQRLLLEPAVVIEPAAFNLAIQSSNLDAARYLLEDKRVATGAPGEEEARSRHCWHALSQARLSSQPNTGFTAGQLKLLAKKMAQRSHTTPLVDMARQTKDTGAQRILVNAAREELHLRITGSPANKWLIR